MKTYHITWATQGRQPAFPAEEARRAVLRALASVGGRDIVLFAIVDDHVHLVVIASPARLRRLQGALSKVLNNRSAAPFSPPFVKEVVTRSHMNALVGYCLNQFAHHGLADDPATATGSCFADLIGARRLPGLSLPISTALPRFRLRDAYEAVRLGDELGLADDAELRRLGAARLAELVAETLGVGPGFAGNKAGVAEARRVAARLALDAGFRPRDIAEPLGITAIASARLAARPVEEADLRAVRKRVTLIAAAAGRVRAPEVVRDVVREPTPPPYLVTEQVRLHEAPALRVVGQR
ncbi:hypothetical protein LBMAG42_44010 [Deltaproteobacteria bacterium]|nr:hypothetical protein LBMAG42_44010 [Deltaproteobacteria bacterium]